MSLTRDHIIKSIQNHLELPRNRSAELVESVLELMKQTLGDGEDVLISGFGKFCVRDKGKRRGRNPQTGEDVMLDARRVVRFKCSGKLRDKINGKGR